MRRKLQKLFRDPFKNLEASEVIKVVGPHNWEPKW
jgi:hypothetical protein